MRTPLDRIHTDASAGVTPLAGRAVPDEFGDRRLEYLALREGVALMDRSHWGRLLVLGKDALDLLNRLSTNQVDQIPPGTGKSTVLTTSKGRVIDLLHLFALEGHLLLLTSPKTQERIIQWIDFYTFGEEIEVYDVTESTALFSLLGPEAGPLLQAEWGVPTGEQEPYASATLEVNGVGVALLRSDPLGEVGFDLVVPADRAAGVWQALLNAGASRGIRPVGKAAFEVRRVEASLPCFGRELTEEVNPHEAGLLPYISFTKGCYVGQEVILRLNTYQKVLRYLRPLTFSAPGADPGCKLWSQGKEVGTVTSAVRHPVTGEELGLGYVRKAVAAPGTALQLTDAGGNPVATALVGELPLGAPVLP